MPITQRDDASELSARIEAAELAFRMQMSAPEAVDLSAETAQFVSPTFMEPLLTLVRLRIVLRPAAGVICTQRDERTNPRLRLRV